MYDEETEQLSADLTNISGVVVDLTKTAEHPGGVSLFTDATQTEYKSVYQYLHDISEIYDELDAKSKQQLMEKLFGKHRANIGQAILQNMQAADKALNNMANSAGNADAEMSIITESISYHFNALKETWTGVAQSFFQSDSIIAVTDALTGLSNVVDWLVKNLGGLGTTAVLGGLVKGIMSVS